ncbi:hypothetical protein G6F68_009532 [Rhizopus microsporus]|nr:hypothetical protein G6F68_009532 [Rhizopus microsporus]
MRGTIRASSSWLCSMIATVRPRWFNSTMRADSSSISTGLTPANGSSSKMQRGSSISSRPRSSSFFCPPDSLPAGSSATRDKFRNASSSCTRSALRASSRATSRRAKTSAASFSPRWSGAAAIMLSKTVSWLNSRGTWNVRARPRRTR